MSSFQRLIRFIDESGQVRHGNLAAETPANEIVGSTVEILSRDLASGFTKTGTFSNVKHLLAPLADAPIILCVGLNYSLHSHETNFLVPSQPIIFATPSDRLAGPVDNVLVPPIAHPELDYEGELTLVIGKDCKDVQEEDALDCVFGYTVGNDVSARNLLPQSISGMQMGYAKSFDTFGPIGPCIASPAVIPDPQQLRLVTKVNGEIRQDVNTSEMIWTVRKLIVHATQGRTVRQGTVIMTGTPNGVGWFSNGFVKNGDVVEVSVSGIGSIQNKMHFL